MYYFICLNRNFKWAVFDDTCMMPRFVFASEMSLGADLTTAKDTGQRVVK